MPLTCFNALLDSHRELIHDPTLVDSHVNLNYRHEDKCKDPLTDYLAKEPDHVLQMQACQQHRQDVEY